ncbi:hypothetical protein EST38_g2140 [Candolleomyces aberdarensis]|uniref:Nephrocystin 3-like N-terminal domain-containing protein n=1 Tax=Candolleomyces aberdarensis TaxID=2316362 RepID=A0A4Q2DTP5_9AGAR|nr:hypothetical protein EST38_g2140 [Candolleomyces aberdarensis]
MGKKTASLSIAVGILQAVNSAADVFPPLKTITNAALFVAQTADSFHTNKEDWTRLSSHVQIYIAALLKHIGEDNDPKVDDWKESLLSLDRSLQEIQAKIFELRGEKFSKRLWRHFKTKGQFVKDLQRDVDDAIKLCNLRASLMTTSEVVKHLQQGDPNKTIGSLLQKFKDDIASDNDRTESLRQLPNARGASWDSSRTCLLGTRVSHRREIETWIANCTIRDTPEILLIADAMGSGKSTLAHSVFQEAQRKRWLVTSFFFSRLRGEEVTSRHLFGSLIRGFCRVNKGTGDTIARILRDDATLLDASPTRQFQEIILPICPLLPKSVPLVVVVDALDEGCDTELLKILRDGVPLLPTNLCIIVTSRPDDSVMSWLEHHSHIHLLSLSLIQGNDTQQDIEKHIYNKFRYPPLENTIFPPQLVQDFVHRSEGVFLWVDVILEYIKPFLHCDEALREIIDSSAGTPELLDAELKVFALYEQILSKLMWKDRVFVRAYKSVVTAKEPLSINTLVLPFSYGQPIDGNTMVKVANKLRSLLNNFSPDTPEEPIRLLHASVREYLSQHIPSAKPYDLDIEECNRVMAKLTLSTIENEIKAHVPPLGYLSGEWDIGIFHVPPKLPPIPPGSISEQLSYSCRHPIESIMPLLDAVETYVRLVKANPELFEPNLAACLGTLSIQFIQLEKWQEAFEATEKAVPIYRRLAHREPELYEGNLSDALDCLCTCLVGLGRDDDALVAIDESIDLTRKLLKPKSMLNLESHLAYSLHERHLVLKNLNRYGESLRCLQESVDVHRRVFEANPSQMCASNLGKALDNLSALHHSLGQDEDASLIQREAVELHRTAGDWIRHAQASMGALASQVVPSSTFPDIMSIPNVTTQTQPPLSEKPPSSLSQQGYKMHPAPSLYSSKEISIHQSEYDCESGHRMNHDTCPHRRACRSRRYFLPVVAVGIIFSLIALAMFSCMGTDFNAWLAGLTTGGGDLVRRAAEAGASAATDAGTGSGNNPIVDKKYYLIIIFVGLVLVLFAGIMLSAWCCKGAFRNPLCCPCYLCACCGGLACLECIGCGLCAEGFEQLAQDG